MRRVAMALLAASATAAAVAPTTASAGVVLGAGTGLTLNGGSVGEGLKMTDLAAVMVPLRLEAGWKFADQLTLTGFFNMNFGVVSGDLKDACDALGNDCLVSQSRAGVQGRWNFSPDRQLDPWVGAGVAWEVLAVDQTTGSGSSYTVNLHGAALDLAAGVDYWLSPRLSLSPYLGFSIGKYTEGKEVSAIDEDWSAIPDSEQRYHTQITAGVRLGFDFGGKARAAATPAP
jgi:outer membrane protein W